MFEVQGLCVDVGNRPVLRDVDLHIRRGETIALFGPNGSGKTSLLHTIMGMPGYRVLSGKILFRGADITGRTLDQRARMGIGLAFQRPPAVRGVKLAALLAAMRPGKTEEGRDDLAGFLKLLGLENFHDRDINLGFSGGELKRSELLQLLVQGPDLILLDEPDSGVDLVSIKVVSQVINALLEIERAPARRGRAGLIITHAGDILDLVPVDRACVMVKGRILCSGNPRDLLEDINERGYEGCVRCAP